MSDSLRDDLMRPAGAQENVADQTTTMSIGPALKSLREAKQIELSAVSARTKYSAVQLAYLENEQWDRLPHGVPLRGLVRNYAKYLESDVDVMLRLLDDAVGPTKPFPSVTDLGSKQPLQAAEVTPRGEPMHRTWAWVLLIILLLVVFGAYAINRGWVPDEWLIFDWLKALRQ